MAWNVDDSANNSRWRVGRKLGRTVYAQEGDQPSDDDVFLGLMETEGIAASVVEDHNAQWVEGIWQETPDGLAFWPDEGKS